MRDLVCDPATLAGPVDARVVRAISKRYPLDPDFLACMQTCHGGQPTVATVKLDGHTYHVAEFLTLLDYDSKVSGEFRPHFEHAQVDERVIKSISSVMNSDSNTSRCLFADLVPFAATQTGMCLDRGYVDLFCFDYRDQPSKPTVALWNAHKALDAYFAWDDLPAEKQFADDGRFMNVKWDSFLVPIAPSFGDFIELLEPNT